MSMLKAVVRNNLSRNKKELTGIEDEERSVEHLRSHQWNIEAAVQDAFNEKEGIRPTFGTSPPPPSSPPSSPPRPQLNRQIQNALLFQGAPPPPGGREAVVRRRDSWLGWTLNLAVLPLRFILSAANEVLQLFGMCERKKKYVPFFIVFFFLSQLMSCLGPSPPRQPIHVER